jgi:probable HAF family extracellular repeat protein
LVPLTGGLQAYVCDLGFLDGGDESEANDLNGAGQIVGWSKSSAGKVAFLWDGGPMQDIGTLDGGLTVAYAINGNGTIAGQSYLSGQSHAVIWPNGSGITDLGTASGSSSTAFGINDDDEVAGTARTSWDRAVLWTGPFNATLLLDAAADYSTTNDISTGGDAVGTVKIGGVKTAVRWTPDGLHHTPLGSPGGASEAMAWNAAGIVGTYKDGSNDDRPIIWNDDGMQDLGTLGGSDGEALDINGHGHVVGESKNSGGKFLATLWAGGAAVLLDAPPNPPGPVHRSAANGINDNGWAVGYIEYEIGGRWKKHATLWVVQGLGTDPGERTVDEILDDLDDAVNDLYPDPLDKGQRNSLLKKIRSARRKADQGKNNSAANKLGALINEVNDLVSTGILTQPEAQKILEDANEAIDLLT